MELSFWMVDYIVDFLVTYEYIRRFNIWLLDSRGIAFTIDNLGCSRKEEKVANMESDLKSRVLAYIPKGKQNAITGEQLAISSCCYHYNRDNKLVLENRSMRLAIQELINDGEMVCSSPGRKADKATNTPKQEPGYFIADNPQEIKEALIVLRAYGKSIFHHYSALKKAGQKHFSGQLTLKI